METLLRDDAEHLKKAQQVRGGGKEGELEADSFKKRQWETEGERKGGRNGSKEASRYDIQLAVSLSLSPFPLSLPQDAAAHNQAGRAKSRFQKRREMMIEETGDFDPIYG